MKLNNQLEYRSNRGKSFAKYVQNSKGKNFIDIINQNKSKQKRSVIMKKNSLIITAVFIVTIMFVSASIQSNQLFAQDTGIITVQSKTSYNQTVKELKHL